MNILTDIHMRRAKLSLQNYQGVPTTPGLNEIALINGIPHVYSFIDNQLMWYPLTNKRSYYSYVQSEPSEVWTVNHDLGTADILVTVYDHANNLIMTNPELVSTEQIILRFAEPTAGRVIVFGASSKPAGFINFEETEEIKETVSYGTEEPDIFTESAIYFQLES